MTTTQDAGPADLLHEILTVPADARVGWLAGRGAAAASLISELASAAEQLAMTELSAALDATAVVIGLADEVGDGGARVRARQARAQALAYANRFPEALDLLAEAVAIADAAGSPADAARARLAMLHGLARQGRYNEAIAAGECALRAFQDAGERVLTARAEINLGVVHRMRDHPETALLHFERARPLVAEVPTLKALLESNRAEALLDLNHFADAEEAFESAGRMFDAAGARRAVAIVEGNLADLMSRQGRLQPALYHFERACRFMEADRAPGDLARLQAEEAEAYSHVGLFEEALESYRHAIPQLQSHGLAWESARAHAGMGRVLLRLGRGPEAAKALLAAADAFEGLGHRTGSGRVALLLGELAAVQGRNEIAGGYLLQALGALKDRPADAAAVWNRLARLALERGDHEAAQRFVSSAFRALRKLQVPCLMAELLHTRARLRCAGGRRSRLLADLRGALEHIERMRGTLPAERFRTAFLGDRVGLYEELAAALLHRGKEPDVREAFHVVERAKSRALLDLMSGAIDLVERSRAVSSDPKETALLEEYMQLHGTLNALYGGLDDIRPTGRGPPARDGWREETQDLERRMHRLEGRLAATRGLGGFFATPADAESVQRKLSPEEALVQYFFAGDELVAFVVRDRKIDAFRGLGSAGDVAQLVERFHFQIARAVARAAWPEIPATGLIEDVEYELGELHRLLLAPLAEALEGAARLVIVPHGTLHVVPFHALHDGRRYVLEDREVAYAPSASLMLRLTERGGPAPGAFAAPLVVGVPDREAPLIEQEAASVAGAFREPRVLSGPEATAERFAEMAAESGLIHLACHGRFSATNPMLSGLRLADRWVTVRDLYGLRLPGSVVALSACDTGRSALAGGDELMGLARAFFVAGASALVLSLWPVNDESAAILMASAYRLWQNDGAGRRSLAAALRKAQCELRRTRPHPAYWAPFLVMGTT